MEDGASGGEVVEIFGRPRRQRLFGSPTDLIQNVVLNSHALPVSPAAQPIQSGAPLPALGSEMMQVFLEASVADPVNTGAYPDPPTVNASDDTEISAANTGVRFLSRAMARSVPGARRPMI